MHDLSSDDRLTLLERLIADATATMTATDRLLADTLVALRQGQQAARRLQGWMLALVGLSIVFLGWSLWYASTQHAQIAAILRLMSH